MGRMTHPYFLLVLVLAASTIMTAHIAQKRARLSRVRRGQEETLAQLITVSDRAQHLRAKRNELLTRPASVAEIAMEKYGYVWNDANVLLFLPSAPPPEKHPIRVQIVETGPERVLGEGGYIWKIPVAVAGICAAVFFFFGLFEQKVERGM